MAGEELTERERAAVKRFEKEREEKLRWQYYASIPEKHWRAMSGRQTKVLNEQAKLYDADHWKTWVQQRLETPLGQPGSMTFYKAPPQEHMSLVKHLTAETKTEEFIVGKGVVTRWERVRKANHWFDALYNASVAGYYCNVRLPGQEPPPPRKRISLSEMAQRAAARRPDGRPWIDMDRWREMQA